MSEDHLYVVTLLQYNLQTVVIELLKIVSIFAQIIVVYMIMIIITSLVQISLRSPDKELWLILLSSSIGYILPSPCLKFRKQANPISADETDSPKLKP